MKLPRKLSKQQKLILALLSESTKLGFTVNHLSHKVAEEFNKEHNDRIWDIDKQKRIEIDNFKEEINKTENEEDKQKLVHAGTLFPKLLDSIHMKKQLLTSKHRASFSRSLKRLEERGLVYRINKSEFKTKKPYVKHYQKAYENEKTTTVLPTKKGLAVAKEIRRRVFDKRYNLEFTSLKS